MIQEVDQWICIADAERKQENGKSRCQSKKELARPHVQIFL